MRLGENEFRTLTFWMCIHHYKYSYNNFEDQTKSLKFLNFTNKWKIKIGIRSQIYFFHLRMTI